MATQGKAWWASEWFASLTQDADPSRIVRGCRYAVAGNVRAVQLHPGMITAQVRGQYRQTYTITLQFTKWDATQREIINNIIMASPYILSSLIQKKLPREFTSQVESHSLTIFPQIPSGKENVQCTCADYEVPCKHIVAVLYFLTTEINANPSLIFHLNGYIFSKSVHYLSDKNVELLYNIPSIKKIFQNRAAKELPYDESTLDALPFAKIPNTLEHIFMVLQDDLVIAEKNFYSTLSAAYQYWQRNPYGCAMQAATEKNMLQEWGNPSCWQRFTLILNDRHALVKIMHNAKDVSHENTLYVEKKIVVLLQNTPTDLLPTLCKELRFLHVLLTFSIQLMKKSAMTPQILYGGKTWALLRWVPALFQAEVREIYAALCASCPTHLLQYGKAVPSKEEQVTAAVAVLLRGLMHDHLPKALHKELHEYVGKFFFTAYQCKISDHIDNKIANASHMWLRPLYHHTRKHRLCVVVHTVDEQFFYSLEVACSTTTIPLTEVLHGANYENVRIDILPDIATVCDYIAELKEDLASGLHTLVSIDIFSHVFLKIFPILRAMGVTITLPESLRTTMVPQLHMQLQAKQALPAEYNSFMNLSNLLDFNWKIAIGNTEISIKEFKKMTKKSHGLIRFMDQYLLMDSDHVQMLQTKIEKLPQQLSSIDVIHASLSGEAHGAHVHADTHTTALFKQLTTQAHTPLASPHNLQAQLRPYQERGFNWLIQNIRTGFGSILADDMGLGKTIQVIAVLLYLKNEGCFATGQRALIIAPTGLISNWYKEIERFAPDLHAGIYHGNKRELPQGGDVVLTSYGTARSDSITLNTLEWFLVVIDEAQNIKNPLTAQSKAIKSIISQHKIAMSGTPVENRLLEYWSIFDFTNRHYLGSSKQFKDTYASPIEKERDHNCLQRFHKITGPFVLRRLKSDRSIIADLPEKIENNRYCSLTPEQAALYQATINLSLQQIDESTGIARKGLVLKLINSLKQICNHPAQFSKTEHACIEQSGKLILLLDTLLAIQDLNEKSIIFTQYRGMGNIISTLLSTKLATPVPFLHGGLSRTSRDKLVHDFQNLSNPRTLIVSLKAGGTGLNLNNANHVMHYDLWWNPAVEAQATDRAYRIGQERNVMVHRFLTLGTFEERIDAMIQSKKDLATFAVHNEEKWITEMSTEHIQELLHLKNYDL